MRGQEERDQGSGGRSLQREVLAYALVEYPVPISIAQLCAELGPAAPIERAIDGLVEDGLLEWEGDEIVPTAAAIRFNRIEPIEPPSPD